MCNLEDDCQAFEYDGYTVCIFHAVTADSKSRFSAVDASLERHDASELRHPDTIRLYEYDRQNGTEYLETLYQYLLHDRNAVQAAKVLYVHRNTMSYRLEKLREMLTFDMEDGDTRIFVLMSILLLKCQADKLEES